jgi:hypothetical protein
MAAEDDDAEVTVAADDTRPTDDAEAIAAHGDRAAPRLDPVYVRLREILHRTRARSDAEPWPTLPGMEAY